MVRETGATEMKSLTTHDAVSVDVTGKARTEGGASCVVDTERMARDRERERERARERKREGKRRGQTRQSERQRDQDRQTQG